MTDTTRWTPGPWEALGDTVHSAHPRFAGMEVADCSFGTRGPGNARLVAAAPLLLERAERSVAAYNLGTPADLDDAMLDLEKALVGLGDGT